MQIIYYVLVTRYKLFHTSLKVANIWLTNKHINVFFHSVVNDTILFHSKWRLCSPYLILFLQNIRHALWNALLLTNCVCIFYIPHFYIYLWLITCLHIYHVSPWQQSFLNRPWRGHVHCQPYGFWNMNHNLWTDTKWYKYKWIWWEKINNMAVIYHEHVSTKYTYTSTQQT
jgi:hypothetical protein